MIASAFFRELRVVQLVVKSLLFEQLVVRALLDNIAVLHNKNYVGAFDCCEAVCNDKCCSALHKSGKRLLNSYFGARVD